MTEQTLGNLLFALFLLAQVIVFILGGLFVRWVETRREIREIKKCGITMKNERQIP